MTSTPREHGSWAAAVSDAVAKETYDSINAALKDLLTRGDIEVFLQGSYANATNTRADAHVDIVVSSSRAYYANEDRLAPLARRLFDSGLSPAAYTITDLRRDVREALAGYFGASRVTDKDKSIVVAKSDGYVGADVVPAFQYRHFTTDSPLNLARDWVEGITILPLSGGRIVNFPKQHIANGYSKHRACSGRYQATVRQVKRLLDRAVDEGRIVKSLAPGYLLECMTFNAPEGEFVAGDSQRLENVVRWLKHADKSGFTSCDEIHTLFGTDPGGFSISTAQRVADALWNAY